MEQPAVVNLALVEAGVSTPFQGMVVHHCESRLREVGSSSRLHPAHLLQVSPGRADEFKRWRSPPRDWQTPAGPGPEPVNQLCGLGLGEEFQPLTCTEVLVGENETNPNWTDKPTLSGQGNLLDVGCIGPSALQ